MRRAGLIVAVMAALALVVVLPLVGGSLDGLLNPPTVADGALLAAQREATARAIARGYQKSVAQVHQARALRLPIGQAEAARIEAQALDDLRAARRSALGAVAAAVGMSPAEAGAYVRATDPTLETAGSDTAPGVLLAPDLSAIVSSAGARFAQIADDATRELTRPRGSESPATAPPAQRSQNPSPSPTGR